MSFPCSTGAEGLLWARGRFDVQDSGRILPRAKREWVETEPMPEGKRVERTGTVRRHGETRAADRRLG